MKIDKFDFCMSMFVLCLLIGVSCSQLGYAKGYFRGYEDGKYFEKQLPQEIHLMCFNGTTWDRCRQKDGKFLTASGTPAQQIQFYFDSVYQMQKENKNGR